MSLDVATYRSDSSGAWICEVIARSYRGAVFVSATRPIANSGWSVVSRRGYGNCGHLWSLPLGVLLFLREAWLCRAIEAERSGQ